MRQYVLFPPSLPVTTVIGDPPFFLSLIVLSSGVAEQPPTLGF
jgi:hypothetical protein